MNMVKRRVSSAVQACRAAFANLFQDTPYLHTPWCRVLLEKLTGLQLVKKFPAFY
jgi:hypothetical protein